MTAPSAPAARSAAWTGGSAGAVSSPEPLALVDADFGVQFTTELTPPQLAGERRLPVRLGVRNVGPQTWAKGAARVGYHWYYLDGTEAVWQDETTALPQDIEPGGEVSDGRGRHHPVGDRAARPEHTEEAVASHEVLVEDQPGRQVCVLEPGHVLDVERTPERVVVRGLVGEPPSMPVDHDRAGPAAIG